MKKVFIKYNPYKVETEITVDEKALPSNSELNFEERRFQEWVEELPNLLLEEYNCTEFELTFHGTILDYEDLLESVEEAKKSGINIKCKHVKAKELKDKELTIKKIFNDIQKGPFEELKQKDIIRAFELASKSEFEVNVIATMSAGKSTLINALLSKKLMPSKQESCTATISRIKDSDSEVFNAKAYDKDETLLEVQPELNYEIMQKLNANEDVSEIAIEGDIPFVSADDMALVLVDTPGPNNSRDENHKATTYRMLSESSKTLVLYILNATQLGVDDDNNLLNNVAESMKVGGKQSKDRFIFVVNKIDTFRKGEDSVNDSINKVRKYLEDKGINNPSIFPAAALPALDIRTYLKDGDKTDEDLEDEINYSVGKLVRDEEKHLEKYAPLTPSIRGRISNELQQAKEENNKYSMALIHTGIRPIEEYINMYVEKYAKTAKIKNIVDTFDKKLQTAESFEKSKQEIAANEHKHKEIIEAIHTIKGKINNGKQAKEFKSRIDAINFDKKIEKSIRDITKPFQEKLTEVKESADDKMTKTEAEYKVKEYTTLARNIQAEIKVKLETIVTQNIKDNAYALLKEYTDKIDSLSSDLAMGDFNINSFDLVQGDISTLKDGQALINKLTSTESVKVGTEKVKNINRKWYKPWTYFQPAYFEEDVYADVDYVDGKKLANQFLAPIQEALINNTRSAAEYAKLQGSEVKAYFIDQFKQIDSILKNKLTELEEFAADEQVIKKSVEESKKKLAWLKNIQDRVRDILEV